MPTLSRRVSGVLLALAATLLVLASAAAYVNHALFDSGQFSARASAALRDERTRAALADRVTAELLRRRPDLLAARPLIETVVAGLVGSRPFTGLFGAAVRDAHRAVLAGDEDTLTLTLTDAGTVVADALRTIRPSLARRLPQARNVVLVRERIAAAGATAARVAGRTHAAAIALVALALLLGAAGLVLAPDRREAVLRLGVRLALAGLALALLALAVRSWALHRTAAADREAVAAIWDAFAAGLVRTAWTLAAIGVVVAVAARALAPVALRTGLERGWSRLTREPRTAAGRWSRALVLILAGAAIVADPGAAVRVLATAVGILVAALGLNLALGMVAPPVAREAPPRSGRARRGLVAALAAGVALVAAVVALGSNEVSVAEPRTGACQGSMRLCDRTLPEVALVAAHNAMSIPARNWFAAEQDGTIAEQLRGGVRGLLIDTYYADRLPNGRLRTVIPPGGPVGDVIGPGARAAAERLRARLGFRGEGTRGMYLCHTFCEVGATPLAEGLGAVRDFLVTHPEAILAIVNQDTVTPQDFVGAMERAGLAQLALTPPRGSGRWPTLRRMIDTNKRLLVLAEEHAGAAPWYRPAYRGLMMETPYTFPSAAALTEPAAVRRSCRPSRGGTRAALFLLNHWVSTDPTPRPSDADRVNARDVLLRRARTCERIRHHLPNLVAVNFAARGDAAGVVRELNDLPPAR